MVSFGGFVHNSSTIELRDAFLKDYEAFGIKCFIAESLGKYNPDLDKALTIIFQAFKSNIILDLLNRTNLEFWNKVRVHIISFNETKFATPDDPAFEVAESIKTPEFIEFRINVRHYKENEDEVEKLGEIITTAIESAKTGDFSPKDAIILEDEGETHKTILANLAGNGYAVDEETELTLGPTAKDPGLIERTAEEFLLANKRANIENPVMLEIGAYKANGVREFIDKLSELVKDDDIPFLKNASIYLVDAYMNSIQSGIEALQDYKIPENLSGFKINFLHLKELDHQKIIDQYKAEGIYNRITLARAVNVLEAIDSPQVRIVDGTLYRVFGKTGISKRDLEKFKADELYGTKIIPNALYTILADANNQDEKPFSRFCLDRLIELYLDNDNGITVKKLGTVYKKFVNILRVYHSYEPISFEDDIQWPGKKRILWDTLYDSGFEDHFPHMGPALEALKVTHRALHKEGAILTTSICDSIENMQKKRRGNITITPTRAHYIPAELLEAYVTGELNANIERVTASRRGLLLDDKINRCYLIH